MKKTVLIPALALICGAALSAPAAAEDKIGFIYVGPAADAGYNTSMDNGRKYVEEQNTRRDHHRLRRCSGNRRGRSG